MYEEKGNVVNSSSFIAIHNINFEWAILTSSSYKGVIFYASRW